MQFSLKVFLFVACVALFKACHAYDHKNQALWYEIDGSECSLKRQSPIELNSLNALISYGIPSIQFYNYNTNLTCDITNNGHSADLIIPNKDGHIGISGGPLGNAIYVSESIHFHWGSRNYHGCEHVIDNHRCSMELHLVHRNSKYATVADATRHPDGLSVISVSYDVDPYLQQDLSSLSPIVNSLNNILNYNTTTKVSNIFLNDLLVPVNTEEFYTYQGSLTTPPCSQAVTWIVFPQRVLITEQQIARFRALRDSHGEPIVNNYRHLQATGFRTIHLRPNNNHNNEVY